MKKRQQTSKFILLTISLLSFFAFQKIQCFHTHQDNILNSGQEAGSSEHEIIVDVNMEMILNDIKQDIKTSAFNEIQKARLNQLSLTNTLFEILEIVQFLVSEIEINLYPENQKEISKYYEIGKKLEKIMKSTQSRLTQFTTEESQSTFNAEENDNFQAKNIILDKILNDVDIGKINSKIPPCENIEYIPEFDDPNQNVEFSINLTKQYNSTKVADLLHEVTSWINNNTFWDVTEMINKGFTLTEAIQMLSIACDFSSKNILHIIINFDSLMSANISVEDTSKILQLIGNSKAASTEYQRKIIQIQLTNNIKIEELFDFLKKIKNLSDLDIDVSKLMIDKQNVEIFGKTLQSLSSVEKIKLNLSGIITKENELGFEVLLDKLKHIKSLRNLELILMNNQISDVFVGELAKSLKDMKHLTSLSLNFFGGNNSITDFGVFILSLAIKNMKSIQSLSLSFGGGKNAITEDGLNILIYSLNDATSLIELYLDLSNNLNKSVIGLNAIEANLKNIKNLQNFTLNIQENNVTPEALDNLIRLQDQHYNIIFDFNRTISTNKEIEQLYTQFKSFKNISRLKLIFDMEEKINYLLFQQLFQTLSQTATPSNSFIFDFIEAGLNLKEIQILVNFAEQCQSPVDMHFSQFWYKNTNGCDKDISSIANVFQKTKHISNLKFNLQGGSVTNNGIKVLASAIKNIKGIKNLEFSFDWGKHSIDDEGLLYLSNGIQLMKDTTDLTIWLGGGYNKITDNGMQSFAKSLKVMEKMSNLVLSFRGGYHQITDVGFSYLANSVATFKNLSKIYFYLNGGGNSVTDKSLEVLAKSIHQKTNKIALMIDAREGFNEITQAGIDYLKNATSYSQFYLYSK